MSREIYDVDIRTIPSLLHYDVRYLLRAPHERYRISAESRALAWRSMAQLRQLEPAADGM